MGRWLARLTVVMILAGCTPPQFPPAGGIAGATALPAPVLTGEMSLEAALAGRRSVRAFEARPLTKAEIAQLFWAAQGVTDRRGYRTAPSAGALYPLEMYLLTQEGTFHYEPGGHRLAQTSRDDVRTALQEAVLGQEAVCQAPAVFVIAAVYQRTAEKYGSTRGPRYVHLEAGHAAQNLLLQAVTLGLGAVPIGAFEDESVGRVVGLADGEEAVYVIPVGEGKE